MAETTTDEVLGALAQACAAQPAMPVGELLTNVIERGALGRTSDELLAQRLRVFAAASTPVEGDAEALAVETIASALHGFEELGDEAMPNERPLEDYRDAAEHVVGELVDAGLLAGPGSAETRTVGDVERRELESDPRGSAGAAAEEMMSRYVALPAEPMSDAERRVRIMMLEMLPGEQTDRWLAAKNRALDGQRPRDLLRTGNAADADRVIAAAEVYVIGDPQ